MQNYVGGQFKLSIKYATFDKCPTIKFAMTIAAGSKEDGEGDDRMHASWRTVHRSSAQQPTMQTNLGKQTWTTLFPSHIGHILSFRQSCAATLMFNMDTGQY